MVHFSQKKLHIGGILFLLFNEISINISWLEHPVFAFGFRTFKIKNYPCITFNKDIFNYCNRKSDSIGVQIESLLAERVGSFATTSNPAQTLFFIFASFYTMAFVRLIRFALQTCAPCAFKNAQVCDPSLSAKIKEARLGLFWLWV